MYKVLKHLLEGIKPRIPTAGTAENPRFIGTNTTAYIKGFKDILLNYYVPLKKNDKEVYRLFLSIVSLN